jgi:hypothetical protein
MNIRPARLPTDSKVELGNMSRRVRYCLRRKRRNIHAFNPNGPQVPDADEFQNLPEVGSTKSQDFHGPSVNTPPDATTRMALLPFASPSTPESV